MEILIIFLIVISIIVFALVGFVWTIIWLFGGARDDSPKKPTLEGDVLAARRLIKHLGQTKGISQRNHDTLVNYLDKTFPQQGSASIRPVEPERTPNEGSIPQHPEDVVVVKRQVEPSAPAPPVQVDPPVQSKESAEQAQPLRGVDDKPAAQAPATSMPVPVLNTDTGESRPDSVVVAEAVAADVAQTVDAVKSANVPGSGQPGQRPAPWDLPDPPTPNPRRSFAELMSGFMQERNMRWGELTSGILIVLSAVGLVVSLRDELRDTIPYFSSLLFLLITAAIHGAGIYTLKKWKLRNTSRGTLVIGLLLIPLNFVAACVLSGGGEERRALNDPWLWTAITIGLIGFTTMTWWSSKCLLRRGQWPMVVAIIGCGMGTLLLNRVVENSQSAFSYLVYAIPLAVSFVIGTCLIDANQWSRQRWSERAIHRLYLFLGVATFAVVASLAIAIVRAESKLLGLVAMTPIVSVVCLVGSWMGAMVRNGVSSQNNGDSLTSLRVSGYAIEILGLLLLAGNLLFSATHPSIFTVNALSIGFGLIAMLIHQRNELMLPIAWAIVATGVLAGLNLITEKLPWDDWASIDQLGAAALNGKSGLCLLAFGAVVVGIHQGLKPRFEEAEAREKFERSGWVSGGTTFLIGCLVALIASFVNRDNVFDVTTATGLVMLAALGSLVVGVITQRKSGQLPEFFPHVISLLWLGGLAHSLIWNPTIQQWFAGVTRDIGAEWVAVSAVHGLVMAGMAMIVSRKVNGKSTSDSVVAFVAWSGITASATWVGLIFFMLGQTGWATLFATISSVSWFLNGLAIKRSHHQGGDTGKTDLVASVFVFSTAVAVVVLLAELISRFAWCPSIQNPNHWMVQLIGLATWSTIWAVLGALGANSHKWSWLFQSRPRIDHAIQISVVTAVSVLVCSQIGYAVARELFAGLVASPLVYQGDPFWVYAAVFAISIALIASLFVHPNEIHGAASVVVWVIAWGFGAYYFDESVSAGSAVRWLLPVGGMVAAILVSVRQVSVPIWVRTRNRIGLSGPSGWKSKSTQRLINLALGLVCFAVLLISSVTVARVLIHGGEALGGPAAESWFKRISAEVSFGVPIVVVVATFLLYAISERRSWLATIGSAVFQYVVLLAVVLLFLSPHPKLASTWFVGILQAVSLGMSAYGFVWFWQLNRIDGPSFDDRPGSRSPAGSRLQGYWPRQIETHVLINGLLITSLAALAMGRFYFVPDQPGDWISSVGSWMGITSWALFGGLAYLVWKNQLVHIRSLAAWLWLGGWMGMILAGLLSAVVDQFVVDSGRYVPWLSFKVVTVGSVLVAAVQACVICWFEKDGAAESESQTIRRSGQKPTGAIWPMLLSSLIGLLFAARGALDNVSALWLDIWLIAVVVFAVTSVGMALRRSSLGFVAAAISIVAVGIVRFEDPHGWFNQTQPYLLNLAAIATSWLAIGWTVFYLICRRIHHESINRWFLCLPNTLLLIGAIWIALAALLQLPADSGAFGRRASTLSNPVGILTMVSVAGLLLVSFWSDRSRFKIITGCLLSLALVMVGISAVAQTEEWRFVGVNFGAAMTVCMWGVLWTRRTAVLQLGRRLGITRLAALERKGKFQLPIYSTGMGVLIMWAALAAISFVDSRPHRYLAAAVPFALAVGIGCQSNPLTRRWLQTLTLVLATIGGLFLAWADLLPRELFAAPMLTLLVRSLIVLAGGMFVYGGLVTRWVQPGDTWLRTLREMAMVTCGLAVFCLGLTVMAEFQSFREGVGCGIGMAESTVVALLVTGMIVGLILIAIRPQNDPFALSLQGRMGYVYIAEVVVAALVAHLYFTMPWLFQFGIKEYWPYVAMAICFGGVGIAQVLENRSLTVLGKPLFHTAAILPVVVAAAVFAVDSKADVSMVMLTVGMAYLMISYLHQSMLSGAASVVFGTLALWIFVNRFPGYSFLDHPQLWLIPPAVATLIAGQLCRSSLTSGQLATLRYICVAAIYVSSTSEIFISGIGDKLWPPVILALLAVIGIMAGIMLQVKSFLYFGALFLLMAMITMVSHAHQRLDHVWPWWAFGIGLGVAILVMFGLFEKRKNDMKAIAEGMRKWDA